MATARELLEQADALMRKNRGSVDGDIPVLTDAIVTTPSQLRVPMADIPVLTERVEDAVVRIPPPRPLATVASVFEGDPSDWLVMDTIDPALHSVTGKAPDTLAVVPPVTLRTPELAPEPPPVELDVPTRATHKAAGSAPTPPPARSHAQAPMVLPPEAGELPPPDVEYLALPEVENSLPRIVEDFILPAAEYSASPIIEYPAPSETAFSQPPEPAAPAPIVAAVDESAPVAASDERWRALAEQISMQVLQRIDLFTDTGLKEQLARHLQPIVDRASAGLVVEINDQVGKLVRSYVAEAIEREIAQWRSEHD